MFRTYHWFITNLRKAGERRLLLRSGVLALVLLSAAFLLETGEWLKSKTFSADTNGYEVQLYETGFLPQELKVRVDDTVLFINRGSREVWPASDFHPTHGIYPELDPGIPVEPGKSWRFRFRQIGRWNYHDHLAPHLRGTIIVSDQQNSGTTLATYSPCEETDGNKWRCWEDRLRTTFDQKGLNGAFDVFADLYNSNPVFAKECHGFTHILGELAYNKFDRQGTVEGTPKASYCSYGFYHGFMEELYRSHGSIDEARKFCDDLERQFEGDVSFWVACFHGIGHGVTDSEDPRVWGSEDATIAPGLDLCEKLGRNDYEIERCASGVFNALAVMYFDPKYKLRLSRLDPLAICRRQKKPYFRTACYEDLKTAIMEIEGNNFVRAARHVVEIADREDAKKAMDNLTTYAARFYLDQSGDGERIRECRTLPEYLHTSCINGFGAGLMTFGIPGMEYERALKFCGYGILTPEEQSSCFGRVLGVVTTTYSKEKERIICDTVPKLYQDLCGS